MNLSTQKLQSFDIDTQTNIDIQDNGTMIILAGRNLGLGALIQSTVNSIWLARKLGKSVYIWWGKCCLYTNQAEVGNTYAKLFQEPSGHQLFNSNKHLKVYPKIWGETTSSQTLEEIDAKAHSFENYQYLEFITSERDLLIASELCIVYQYLSSDLVQHLAGIEKKNFYSNEFFSECNTIFAHYFRPHSSIQATAAEIWKSLFNRQQPVMGIHCRGTDKVFEKAVPAPHHYIQAAQNLVTQHGYSAFFIATDSSTALKKIYNNLVNLGFVGSQDMKRSSGSSGLHFDPNGAFDNGVQMIIDIELLCKCQLVLAFPGSQIFWWLSRKQASTPNSFSLVPVQPSSTEWLRAIWLVFRLEGLAGFIQFLRIQQGGIRKLLMKPFRKG